ncbi:MAG: hypothetical protein JF588_18360 [Caulobacterales bacterium]|nr:hypothetical protein [Caulobacterales bacterium]
MLRNTLVTSLLASSALALAVAAPAHADKKDRAQEAIAAADAKLHTAESIGTGVEVPAATAAARAALMQAKEDLSAGRKSASIQEAIRASALADTAIGELQRRKDNSLAAAHEAAQASAAAAREAEQQTAAAAQDRASTAEQQAMTAQQQAAEANARAAAAEQAAQSSAADAAAARAAAATQPAQVETSVTTQHTGATHRSTRTHVVKRSTKTVPSDQVTTTTTVTQH